jgi:hypothetical protein
MLSTPTRDASPDAKTKKLVRVNLRLASQYWANQLTDQGVASLKDLTQELCLSVSAGELQLLGGRWYVTHSGLLRLASRKRCAGIRVQPVREFCDLTTNRWAFKATVYKNRTCKGFVGYGDADPSNVSPRVRGAEMRVAETRAVNRALRKAYGIGICSVEELGSFSGPLPPAARTTKPAEKAEAVDGNGHHPLRDRLCLLIRQHQLDPALVKAYAADYCDVSELRQASREQVATFINHLAEYAHSDREGLLSQLNGYAPKPVAPAESTAGAGDASEAKVEGAA